MDGRSTSAGRFDPRRCREALERCSGRPTDGERKQTMKIIDVPQTGKLGLTVTYPSRNGLIRRSWVVPANPRTADQLVARSRLAQMAAAWDSLTENQQDAWIAAAAQEQSRPTLGQSGPLTGLQLFVKLNSNRVRAGRQRCRLRRRRRCRSRCRSRA